MICDLHALKTLFGTDLFKTLMKLSEFWYETARKCGEYKDASSGRTLFEWLLFVIVPMRSQWEVITESSVNDKHVLLTASHGDSFCNSFWERCSSANKGIRGEKEQEVFN